MKIQIEQATPDKASQAILQERLIYVLKKPTHSFLMRKA